MWEFGATRISVDEGHDNAWVNRAAVWWISVAALLAGLQIPVLLAQVPPVTDYPNHLARCYALAFLNQDPVLGRMFSAHWQIIPNIAIDVMLPGLMHLFSPLTVGRMMLGLCLLVPTSGAIALSCAVFRERSFWQLSTGFIAFQVMFLMGFMNFCFAIGVALWGAAAWVYLRERKAWLAVSIGVVLAVLAFFSHLMGFFFYALLVGCFELFAIADAGVGTAAQRVNAAKRIVIASVPLILPVILYLRSPLEKVAGPIATGSRLRKLYGLLIPFLGYSLKLDLLVVAPAFVLFVYCLVAKKAWLSRPAVLCAGILAVAYVALHDEMKGGWWVDKRMVVMLAYAAVAGFLPRGLSGRQQNIAAAILALMLSAKIALISVAWERSQEDVRNVRQVIANVEPGSRVLDVDVKKADNPEWFATMPLGREISLMSPTYWHLPGFVLLDRRAFWPTIFAIDAQQPIRVKPPYRDILGVGSGPPDYKWLEADNRPANALENYPFLQNWQQRFDYVLLLNAEGAGDLSQYEPGKLQLLKRQGIAALLRVLH
jgi:hypothetical protein